MEAWQWLSAGILAAGGWYIASRGRLPAAGILGPMFAVGAAACLGVELPRFSPLLKGILQIVIGVYIGCRLTPQTVRHMRLWVRPVALVSAWMLSVSLIIGYLLTLVGHLGLATAMLGTTPGGLAEMSVMAASVGADAPSVALLQTFRLVTTMIVMPIVARRVSRTTAATAAVNGGAVAGGGEAVGGGGAACGAAWGGSAECGAANGDAVGGAMVDRHCLTWLYALLVGAVGGAVFLRLGFPAGGLVGSMVTVGIARLAGVHVTTPPLALRTVAQVGIGAMVGTYFSWETLHRLAAMALPVAFATGATVFSGLALASLVHRTTGASSNTALLACAPAGVTQMAVIADELGADSLQVAVFQLVRLICAVLVLPIIFRLML